MKIQFTFDFFKKNLVSIVRHFFQENARLRALRRSHYFDSKWYLENYPDVLSSQMNPARHYLEFGSEEERDPGPLFSTAEYLLSNPDIKELDINPLLHYEGHYSETSTNSSDKTRPNFSEADRTAILLHIETFPKIPLISVVMPVFDTSAALLSSAIESVLQQCYQNWELCIADDASRNPETIEILKQYSSRDPRIKIVYRELNGNISAATNSALKIANGEFVAFFDHDDLLHETALYEIALEINNHPDVNIIYSDEDTVDESGKRSVAHHKTSFNPELFLGQNMINHLGVYRRNLIEKIGGFRIGFEGSQDYDLALRAWAESSIEQIRHVPAILYHWRRAAAKKSFSEAHLAKCIAAARAATQEYLDIEGEGAKVTEAPYSKFHSRIIRQVPIPQPLVTVIIPTKDRADLLSVCVDGILNRTDYTNIEILIIDHESKSPGTLDFFKKIVIDPRIRIVPYKGQFNYSAINNMAVREAKGSVLALLNNDIEVLEPHWLSEMVSHAIRPKVGAVGAKLLYPNGRVQHAGVVLGYDGSAGHSFHYAKKNAPCYFGYALLTRSVSAVTGACLVVRKEIFLEVGGLNEENLAVAFNDVDLCLKIQTKGYRNIWTPFAKLIHHESVTRGYEDTREKKARVKLEIKYLQKTWNALIADDPFYNPNLTFKNHNFDRISQSRRSKPWAAFL